MSNHFTGLSLGPPLGDQRLDLCDLYAFVSPADPTRTVIIMNANPLADALHPDAIYRVAIDNDGDLENDIAFSYVFSEPRDGKQTVDVYLAANEDAESAEAVGEKIFSDVPVSFVGDEPHIATSGDFTFFAGARSDAFFFDFDGIKNLFDTSGKRNFTDLTLPGESPWTGVDSNTKANVFSTAIEMPTDFLGADPDIRIWGRCSVRIDGNLLHVDRAGHPSISSFFNTDDTKEEYNASEPVHDRCSSALPGVGAGTATTVSAGVAPPLPPAASSPYPGPAGPCDRMRRRDDAGLASPAAGGPELEFIVVL